MKELFTTDSSQKCLRDCLDKGYEFCKSFTGESGICCENKETCPSKDFCSFEPPRAALGIRYWTCPIEPLVCGSSNLVQVQDLTTVSINRFEAKKFRDGMLCSYRIVFPYEAGIGDAIKLDVLTLMKTTAYAVETGAFNQ